VIVGKNAGESFGDSPEFELVIHSRSID
jgi:hypothetical protein